MGISIQKHQLLEISKAMRQDEINRQVNEAREGQRTKDKENRSVTSDIREKPTEHIWKTSLENISKRKE